MTSIKINLSNNDLDLYPRKTAVCWTVEKVWVDEHRHYAVDRSYLIAAAQTKDAVLEKAKKKGVENDNLQVRGWSADGECVQVIEFRSLNKSKTKILTEKPNWLLRNMCHLWHGRKDKCIHNSASLGSRWDFGLALKKFCFFDSSRELPKAIERYYTGHKIWELYPNNVVVCFDAMNEFQDIYRLQGE